MQASASGPSLVQAWLAARGPWTRRALAAGAGALATLGHAPFFVVPAYLLAIVALVWLIDAAAPQPRRLRRGFALGWLFGLGHYLTGLNWIASPFMVDPEAWGLAWAAPAALIFAGGLALFWGAGCALAMALWTTGWRRLPAFALAVFASEWLRGHVFGGFPWLLPGYVWAPGEPVSQIASLVGVYGLSALTLLICAAPAGLADPALSAGRRFAPLLAAALALGAAWGWGAQRVARAPLIAPGEAPLIRVADPGLTQVEKWLEEPDQEWRVLARYLDVSGPPDPARATILVWPEGAVPVVNFFPLESDLFMGALAAGLGDRTLIMGVSRRELSAEGVVKYYNSAVVIDGVSGSPRIGQIYDKHRLVPFGEFIPLWSYFSGLDIAPLQRIGAGFTPGAKPVRMVVAEAPPAAALICYEAIFPGLTPRGEWRPGWIVNVTNDAWFGSLESSPGPWQHYAAARYRAIEEGLPLVRAASGGVSAIIDATGRALAETHGSGGHAEAQLPPTLPATPYARWGFFLTWGLVAAIAALRFAPVGIPRVGFRR